jgi:hypothetical protein
MDTSSYGERARVLVQSLRSRGEEEDDRFQEVGREGGG